MIYIFFPFFSFCECVCVCFCVWCCLYSCAFTICSRVLSVHFLFFSTVFSTCYHWWICVLVWLLSSFFFYYLTEIFFHNYFLFFILITTLFYFIFYLLLSFFSPFYSELCGWQALSAPARCQGCTSEVGKPSSGHWSTRDLPAPHNIKQRKSPRELHLNTKTQLQSMTSKLQCWTPYTKQLARQEHNPIH